MSSRVSVYSNIDSKKTKAHGFIAVSLCFAKYRGPGLNRHEDKSSRDFKSLASTNSATPAHKWKARDGIRTRDPDLGKVVLYQLSYSRIVLHFIFSFYLSDPCPQPWSRNGGMLYQLSYSRICFNFLYPVLSFRNSRPRPLLKNFSRFIASDFSENSS